MVRLILSHSQRSFNAIFPHLRDECERGLVSPLQSIVDGAAVGALSLSGAEQAGDIPFGQLTADY